MALLVGMVAVDWAFVVRVLPEFERYKPVPEFSRVLQERLQPGDVVTHYQVSLPSMVYYLRRHVDQYVDDPPFVSAIRRTATSTGSLGRRLPVAGPANPARTCIIDRRRPSRSNCARSLPGSRCQSSC